MGLGLAVASLVRLATGILEGASQLGGAAGHPLVHGGELKVTSRFKRPHCSAVNHSLSVAMASVAESVGCVRPNTQAAYGGLCDSERSETAVCAGFSVLDLERADVDAPWREQVSPNGRLTSY